MLKYLARYPRFNGFLLGVLQGVPQGMVLSDQEQMVLPALSLFDENLVFVVGFGFFVPLVFFCLIVMIRGAKRTKWWVKLSRYVHLYDMMFWACASFAAGGLYALDKAGIDQGYGIFAFFAACGGGLLVAGILETRLKNKMIQKDI